jgi:hypothetical protein
MNPNTVTRPDVEGARERTRADDAVSVEEKRSVDRDDIRRAFAVALSMNATADQVRPVRTFAEAEATPARWRQSDVSMTEFAETISGAPAGLTAASSDEKTSSVVSRLQTSVNTGELGRVAFTVDRSNSGLSIVIEVTNDAAKQAVEADKRTLLATLRAAGMTVLSFRILNRGGAGTELALRGSVSDAKTPHFTKPHSRTSGDGDDDDDDAPGDRLRVVG